MKLAETCPGARVTGVDLSMSELRHAQRRAAEAGLEWDLHRAPAEDIGLPEESFDLVFSDVAPYRLRSPYQAWYDDWDAENGHEPRWRTERTGVPRACVSPRGPRQRRKGGPRDECRPHHRPHGAAHRRAHSQGS